MSANVRIDTGPHTRFDRWFGRAAPRRPVVEATATAPAARPAGASRGLLRICTVVVMMLYAIDGTIANVALPHMQGSLSATQDQSPGWSPPISSSARS